ncbi:MAG: DUF4390 domain-containing protein [Gammaproteobacteria bacterium]|nr:DUF4390 domain-containing protein [Gammaproteobacteria bacterium]
MKLIYGLLLMFFVSTTARAEQIAVFAVENANFSMQNSLLLLDARLMIELPEYISIAVDRGFAVPLMFEVEILEIKNYWFDKKIVSLKQQYMLHYLPMLDSYVISDVNKDQRHYFDSREQAVGSIEVIYHYAMLDISNIAQDLEVYARLRVGLDVDELPLPLQSSSLWDNDWGLQSEWFNWEIDKVRP